MAGRARLYYNNKTNQPISWRFTLPFNATMLQWIANWSGIPTNYEDWILRKISVVHTDYDVTLFESIPAQEYVSEYVCTGNNWEFRRGDKLEVTFSNGNGNLVAFEAVFKEAD